MMDAGVAVKDVTTGGTSCKVTVAVAVFEPVALVAVRV